MNDVDAEATTRVHELMPYTRLLGVEVIRFDADEVRARVAWAPERCTSNGLLHGGVLMGLADAMGGMVAFANLPADATGTTTVNSATNFLRGVSAGHLHGVGRALHKGRTTVVVDTELFDDAGRLVGRVTQTQLVLR